MGKPQVVIVRKDKRIRHKFLHAIAFGLTGGASGIVTAAEAASHAGYNARTRKLQEQSGTGESVPGLSAAGKRRTAEEWDKAKRKRRNAAEAAEWRAEHVPSSREYRERHSGTPEA